jgi:hypothetical protein
MMELKRDYATLLKSAETFEVDKSDDLAMMMFLKKSLEFPKSDHPHPKVNHAHTHVMVHFWVGVVTQI